MNEQTGQDPIGGDTKHEEQSRNHGTASLSFLRQMQRYFGGRRRERRQLRLWHACPSQSRFAAISSVTMNDSALRRLVDGGNESVYIDRLGIRAAGALAQRANIGKNAPVLK
jgi:hypothetical protein